MKRTKGITLYNESTDTEIDIEHSRAFTLSGGFYVVQDFRRVRKTKGAILKALREGHKVYHLNAYCGNGPTEGIDLVFTGKIVWKNENFYEISSFGGGGEVVGKVPAGTLVVGISDD